MTKKTTFDLETFLPYLLNQAAEVTSRSFQPTYQLSYGLSRCQWRVVAHLGKFGAMTAVEICRITHEEKTKVSRAVAALEEQGMLVRRLSKNDRRAENLQLTRKGQKIFADLGERAVGYERHLRQQLGAANAKLLSQLLHQVIEVEKADTPTKA